MTTLDLINLNLEVRNTLTARKWVEFYYKKHLYSICFHRNIQPDSHFVEIYTSNTDEIYGKKCKHYTLIF